MKDFGPKAFAWVSLWRCQLTNGKRATSGGWFPPNKIPLIVDSKKASVKPLMTPHVVTDSGSALRAFQISHANQPCDAVSPSAAMAIRPNITACQGSLEL